MSKTLCLFHANCPDGLGSAWAVHRALGDDVEFAAAKYGESSPYAAGLETDSDYTDRLLAGVSSTADFGRKNKLRGRDILIVDFSYPLPVLRAMAKEARSVLVIDHHATAQEDLSKLLTPRPALSYDEFRAGGFGKENIAAIFDMNRSGAGLTWDYLASSAWDYLASLAVIGQDFPRQSRPRIIDLIEDRDLWKFKFGDETRAFHALLTSYDISDLPAMFERLTDLENAYQRHDRIAADVQASRELKGLTSWEHVMAQGSAILRANVQAVASAVTASRRTIRIAGHVVPCANAPHDMASDAGELLCKELSGEDMDRGLASIFDTQKDCPRPLFSATYYDGADGKRHFSLRSPSGGADVGQIAKAMAEKFNAEMRLMSSYTILDKYHGTTWVGGGHKHSAGFDAPLGWEGE